MNNVNLTFNFVRKKYLCIRYMTLQPEHNVVPTFPGRYMCSGTQGPGYLIMWIDLCQIAPTMNQKASVYGS